MFSYLLRTFKVESERLPNKTPSGGLVSWAFQQVLVCESLFEWFKTLGPRVTGLAEEPTGVFLGLPGVVNSDIGWVGL